MNPRKCLIAVSTLLLLSSAVVQAHEDDKLGKVTFPTSCDAKVQAEFESGVVKHVTHVKKPGAYGSR